MIRPTQDNVVIRLLPGEAVSRGGIVIPEMARKGKRLEARRALVLAVGPGHYGQARRQLGDTTYTVDAVFIPTELKPGDVVLVDPQAGQDYSLDLSIPRHNKPTAFAEWGDERGELRIIREGEAHCVLELDADERERLGIPNVSRDEAAE